MAQSKVDFKHLFIEAILIVFTVFFALALNEWWSTYKEEQTKEAVLKNIIEEIKRNKSDIESKMGYHLEVSQRISSYLESDSLWNTLRYNSSIEAVLQIMNDGIRNPNVQYGAWRSAELSGIVNKFDFETIYILSNVYRIQKEGADSTWKVLAKLFTDPGSFESDNARRLALMFQLGFRELYAQEKYLVAEYETVLKKFED